MADPVLPVPSRLPRLLRLAIIAAAAAVLLYLSLAPTRDLPGVGLVWDKAEHAIAYLVLMGLGLAFAPRRLRAFTLFALCLGLAVEILQANMGFGRQGDWRDMVANSLGVLTGFLTWRWALRRRRT